MIYQHLHKFRSPVHHWLENWSVPYVILNDSAWEEPHSLQLNQIQQGWWWLLSNLCLFQIYCPEAFFQTFSCWSIKSQVHEGKLKNHHLIFLPQHSNHHLVRPSPRSSGREYILMMVDVEPKSPKKRTPFDGGYIVNLSPWPALGSSQYYPFFFPLPLFLLLFIKLNLMTIISARVTWLKTRWVFPKKKKKNLSEYIYCGGKNWRIWCMIYWTISQTLAYVNVGGIDPELLKYRCGYSRFNPKDRFRINIPRSSFYESLYIFIMFHVTLLLNVTCFKRL